MSELTTQNQAEEQGPARTVVVAEDEALIRLDIVEILKDQGFDVVAETDNGKTAVELAQKHRPRPRPHGCEDADYGRHHRS